MLTDYPVPLHHD